MGRISNADKAKIIEYVSQGHNDATIVGLLGWKNKDAVRSVAIQRKKLIKDGKPTPEAQVGLDQMTKENRFKHIQKRFASSPRTKFVIDSFGKEERELFADEYFRVLKSTDSLTEAEEQQLFTAMLEFILSMRSLRMKTYEEKLYSESMRGQIPVTIKDPADPSKTVPNPTFRHQIDPRFESEYNSHLKNYERFMEALKMSRKQRLDRIKQDRKSLVDVAMSLSSKDAQNTAADEIERLAKMQDDELRGMIENGYLIGIFEE